MPTDNFGLPGLPGLPGLNDPSGASAGSANPSNDPQTLEQLQQQQLSQEIATAGDVGSAQQWLNGSMAATARARAARAAADPGSAALERMRAAQSTDRDNNYPTGRGQDAGAMLQAVDTLFGGQGQG